MSQENDEDGTVIRPVRTAGSGTASTSAPAPAFAGHDEHGEDGLSLRIGARLGEFEITRRLGEGGFSIVYLALDHSLERTVALKEYMPSSLAARVGSTQVQPRSQRHRDTFELGLKSFVNEAKLLASFDHPALVKVYRFWEENGTAYMAMPYYQGVTVKEAVRAMPAPPDEAWLLQLLAPLTEALMVIHAQNCYHRDIAPDNVILLASSGKPLLLDFGAARRVIGDMTQGLTVILKSGYAPVEQYAEIPGMKQGSWTDVYALAAVVYWAITGNTPPASVGRMMSDSFVPLAVCAAGRYGMPFLQAIDRALAVLPERRTQTIDALRRELGLAGGAIGDAQTLPAWADSDATVIRPPGLRTTARTVGPSEVRGVPRFDGRMEEGTGAAAAATVARTRAGVDEERTAMPVPPQPSVADREAAPRSRRLLYVVGSVVVLAIAGGIGWSMTRPTRSPADASSAVTPAAAPTTPVVPSATASTPAAAETTTETTSGTSTRTSTQTSTESTAGASTGTSAQTTTSPAPYATPPAAAAPATAPDPVPPAPVSVAVPTPEPPPARPVKKAAPPRAERAETPKPARASTDSAKEAECARVFQRISLGESNPQLVERLKALDCH